jgi:hypothetical protein
MIRRGEERKRHLRVVYGANHRAGQLGVLRDRYDEILGLHSFNNE